MAYSDFQQFLRRLEEEGELRRISEPLDPHLEITEVADRVMKAGGPALLIEKPKGHTIPVAINTMGSKRRMSLALGVDDYEVFAGRIRDLLKPDVPGGLLDKLKTGSKLLHLSGLTPKLVKSGICQEVVREGDAVDLGSLPVMTCWPQDGGPYFTLPLVFTHDPDTGARNCGMYRLQVFDRNTCGMHWQIHKGGAEHYQDAEAMDRRIEVAVSLGGDPACTFASVAPLPSGIDEMLFAGFLRDEAVPMVECRTVGLQVPADSEVVLEGYVEPRERRIEGPFGDHTGYYSLPEPYPVFHVTAITQRREPVYPSTIVGIPPTEDAWMGKAIERIFLPLVQAALPEVVDLNLPVQGCFHNFGFVSIRKRYPGHARKVMHGLWGLGQLMFTKFLFILEHDVDVQDLDEVLWRIGANCDPERDSCVVRGPLDVLDHASPHVGLGGKIGFDCTHKWPGEGFQRPWPDEISMKPEVKERIDSIWGRIGLNG
jgi:4-hydroxy-3-polyprenylbenzoate decarboxylase